VEKDLPELLKEDNKITTGKRIALGLIGGGEAMAPIFLIDFFPFFFFFFFFLCLFFIRNSQP